MTTQSDLAILGLRIGILGTSASLAIAAPIADGNPSDTAATAATRIGVYFDRTGAAEKLGVVVMGTEILSIGVTAVTSAVPFRITDTTTASSTITGSFTTLGGIGYGAAKTMYGGGINIVGNFIQTGATTFSTGTSAFTVNGQAFFNSSVTNSRTVNAVVAITQMNSGNGTAAVSSFTCQNDVSTEAVLRLYGSGFTGTIFGVVAANYGAVLGRTATGAGLFIGNELSNTPIIFGSNAVEVGRFTSGTLSTGDLGLLYTTDASSTTTGSFTTLGGMSYGAAKTLYGGLANFAGLVITVASTTGTAGFRLPHGAAPTSPVNGDIWTTTTGLFARINGSTVGPYGTGGGGTPGGSNTQVQFNDSGAFGGTSGLVFDKITSILSVGGPVRGSAGTSVAPTYSFTGDATSGMYFLGVGSFAFTASGSVNLTVAIGSITTAVPLFAPVGSVGAPAYSFATDINTGAYSTSSDGYGISTGGVLRLNIDTANITTTIPFAPVDGTAGAPVYSFINDLDTGIYRAGANTVGIAVAGSAQITVSPTIVTIAALTDATTTTDGAFTVGGGMSYGATKSLFGGFANFANLVITAASTTTNSGFRMPHGTAPTSPVNGDLWTTTTGLFARINGTTVGPYGAGGGTPGGSDSQIQFNDSGVFAGNSSLIFDKTNFQFKVGDGTTSLPSISFIGNTNTGIYHPSGNNLSFTTAGTTQFVINTVSITSSLKVWVPSGSAATPTYAFSSDTNTGMYLVGGSTIGFTLSGTQYLSLNPSLTTLATPLTLAPSAATGTPNRELTITAAAHTSLTASTEYSSVQVTGSTLQFLAGSITTNRFVVVTAPTYSFSSASTITTAATFAIAAAPIAGTNATITNAYALWVQSGISVFAGVTYHADGAVAAPGVAFGSEVGTGLYRTGSPDALHVAVVGTEYLRISAPAATETALWVYDFDNATVERVTVGAADSGGSGFKLLRIPN